MQDEQGREAEATSASELQPATGRPMDAAAVRKAVGATLGPDTVFSLGDLDLSGALVAVSILSSSPSSSEPRRVGLPFFYTFLVKSKQNLV